MELKGKAAIVTGGGTGIGRACTLLLASRGADVAIGFSRSQAEAEATAAEVRKLGRKALALRADVGRDDEVKAMVEQAAKALGRLDILVNNAGATQFVAYDQLDAVTDELWDWMMGVHVKGPFHCMRAVAPHMRKAGAGAIVNVSSLVGITGRGSSIPYCASKCALNLLTRMMARTLAPTIRVNAVAPGVVNTRWVAGQEAFVRNAQAQTPFHRIAEAADIAQVIVSLIADSDFVTGQIVAVDGGMSA